MPIFESTRKVQTSGSSLVITLPALFAKVCEIEKGMVVSVQYGQEGVMIVSSQDDQQTIEGLLKILERLEEKTRNRDTNLTIEDT